VNLEVTEIMRHWWMDSKVSGCGGRMKGTEDQTPGFSGGGEDVMWKGDASLDCRIISFKSMPSSVCVCPSVSVSISW